MNRIPRLCRCPAGQSWRSSAVLAVAAAAAWRPDPPFPVGWRLPPGWNKHPLRPPGRVTGLVDKLPARIRAHTVAGGLHDWQIILIAAGAALLAIALAVLVHRLRAARRRPVADTTQAMTSPTAAPTAGYPSLPPPGRHP